MFGLTRRKTTADPDPRVDGLIVRMEALEARWKRIDVEWSEWFDKYRRLYARLAKREQRDRDGAETLEDRAGPTISGNGGVRVGGLRNPMAERLLNGVLPRR